MKKTSAVGILLAALVVCAPAHADEARVEARSPTERFVGVGVQPQRDEENNDAAVALIAGGSVTMVSLATGGLLITRGDNLFIKNGGLLGAQSGMVLAPFVAHAVVGETKRGVWFSLPLLIPILSNSIFAGLYPSIIKRAPAGVQYATWTGASLSILGSTLGILDAVRVNERKPRSKTDEPKPTSSVSFLPMFSEGLAGAMIFGSM